MSKTTGHLFLERMFTIDEREYDVAMEIDVSLTRWNERHEPFYSEPMSEPSAELTDLEALDFRGQSVRDTRLLRRLRCEAEDWIGNNLDSLIAKAGI